MAASSLVEGHDLEHVGVERIMGGIGVPAARAAMDEQHGASQRVPTRFPEHLISVADIKQLMPVLPVVDPRLTLHELQYLRAFA